MEVKHHPIKLPRVVLLSCILSLCIFSTLFFVFCFFHFFFLPSTLLPHLHFESHTLKYHDKTKKHSSVINGLIDDRGPILTCSYEDLELGLVKL